MRILYWTQHYWPHIGGVEVLAAEIVPEMRRRGFEVTVVTSHGNQDLPDEEVHDGVAIHRFPFLQALHSRDVEALVACCMRLSDLKRRLKIDLVHINFSDPSVFFHLKTETPDRRRPLLVSVHLAVPREDVTIQSLLRETLTRADWVTATSNAVAADLETLMPAVAAKCTVIYHVVRAPNIMPTPLPWSPPVLLCVGRVVPEKGFDLAIDAFAVLRKSSSATRLIIAGDGPERASLEARALDRGVLDGVDVLGWVSPQNVPALINRATLVLMPSRWREAFGQVALQAAQMARPVVAADVGGLPEIVQHERTGLLFDRNDTEGLATAILQLLRNPDAAHQMGQRARRFATERFSWAEQVDRLEAIYRQLGKQPGAG
jgi:glycosyltransferase involved in cell wall biosynthesis